LKPEIRTTVVTADHHLPDLDTATYRAVLGFIKDTRPDFHYLAGDLLDCHDQSTYLKDPELTGRTTEAIELANTMLDDLHEASPTTITKVIFGNHDFRLTRRLHENPDLIPFLVAQGKTPDHLLADALYLDDRGITWAPYHTIVDHYGFAISHGEYSNIHPSQKEMNAAGMPGASGHVHRSTMWERKDKTGVKHWYTIGCMCNTQVSYRPINTFVNGFGVLKQVVGTDLYTFQQIPIIKGQFIYGNTLYTQDGPLKSS
jgi:hypothetical protein